MNLRRTSVVFLLVTLAMACTAPPKRATLAEIDVVGSRNVKTGVTVPPKSAVEARQAYADYIKHSSKRDHTRLDALQRLAQIEFDIAEKLAKDKSQDDANSYALEDQVQIASINRTIELLQLSLRDYPDAKNNDRTLYQLAKAYEQLGEREKSLQTLAQLASKYPKSPYYVETQFRLAEVAFFEKRYTKAEDIYTEVIVSRKDNIFYEKALYKRGWSRFKQEYYNEALDDFFTLINLYDFADYAKLGGATREQYDEYFRAAALCFAYMGGTTPLNEYFSQNSQLKYVFHTYANVSDIYLKQERYSDAVKVLEQYNTKFSKSIHLAESHQKIVEVWKTSGFIHRAYAAIETLYDSYHPTSAFWMGKNIEPNVYKSIRSSLKDYITLLAIDYHKSYRTTPKPETFNLAKKWYERYLEHYPAQARKDNVHFLYAELLSQHKDFNLALHHYELAAFDADLILNKNAAYEAIILLSRLRNPNQAAAPDDNMLTKLINYSLLYSQSYPTDERTPRVVAHAAEHAFKIGKYQDALNLTDLVTNAPVSDNTHNLYLIKAHSYYKLNKFKEAESIYTMLLRSAKGNDTDRKAISDNLAVSIYKQATEAAQANRKEEALGHYARIFTIVPRTDVAATGLYDAITITANNKAWNETIYYGKQFQSLYPNHRFAHDVNKQLSVAYLNSNQDISAAVELVKLSRQEKDNEYQIAALWKAGELYESKNESASAIASFEEYANRFPSPYPQYLEAMYKLTQLYTIQGDSRRAITWQKKIIEADKFAQAELKTERTNFIVSASSLALARLAYGDFSQIKLHAPFQQNLNRKKQAMQNAINLYNRATSYGVAQTTTEATYFIAEIYRELSKALKESERPKNLDREALDQYQTLLEEQYFAFEDKAIEFFQTNLAQTKQGINDQWIQKSMARLKVLFPNRYDRDVKLEGYVNVLH